MSEHNYTCPFCGSYHLREVGWQLPDENGLPEEVDALECQQCYAGAPLSAWEDAVHAQPQK